MAVVPLTQPTPTERLFAAQDRMRELMGVINTATAALIEVIADVIEGDLWAGPGLRSPQHWLTWQCGASPARARDLVTTAQRLHALPACGELFRSGQLSVDQMATIARRVPAERDREVAQWAASAMVPQLQRALQHLPEASDRTDDKAERVVDPVRDVTFGYRDDGWWAARFLLSPEEGAVLEQALRAGREAEFADRHPDGNRDPQAERGNISWADGALRMADAAITALSGGAGRPVDDRYQILIHVNADDPDRPAHLHLGPALPAEVRRLLACDTTLRVIFEKAGVPVADSRQQRTVPRRIRRLIENRDRGCRVPGCTQTRWLHIHHLVHWEDGGRTQLENLVALCPFHHRLHHQGLLDIDGDPNHPCGLTFTNPRNGQPLQPPTIRPPGDPPHLAARRLGLPPPQWQGPSGEHLEHWAVSWN